MTSEKITSAHVRLALKLRYPSGSHALLWEVPPATGSATRFTDAVAVGLWNSHGHKIEGIEIKVSRSDFLHEMRQPEKSEPVFRYCTHWWLACPQGMVAPDELPETWGLLELMPNGTMRTRKKAPKLKPVPVTLPFFAALARRQAGLDEEAWALKVREHEGRLNTAFEERVKRAVEEQVRRRVEQAERGMRHLQEIKEATGIDFTSYDMDDFLAAVKVVQRLTARGGWHGGIDALHRGLTSALRAIDASGLLEQKEDTPA